MELTKYGGTEILAHIKHDLRQLPIGKSYGNESVDPELSGENYSLIDRGSTAAEVNKYRKEFESEIFKYNRKNLVHAVELVIQCPSDCPPEQHEAFFRTAFDWYCNNYLPAGERCVFVAEVHKDEHKWIETPEGLKDISKEHLHIAYVPAIPAGEKHPDFEYRLNADALTKRAVLQKMHPSLQAELDSKGIKATVYQKKSGDGKTVPLSVKQLKEITEKTGVVIDHSLTVEELGTILSQNVQLTKEVELLKNNIVELEKNNINVTKNPDINLEKNKEELQRKLNEKEAENLKLRETLRNKSVEKDIQLSDMQTKLANMAYEISEVESQNQNLQEKINNLQEQLKTKDLELQQEREKTANLEEKITANKAPKENTWNAEASWGSTSGWGKNTINKTQVIEEEKIW